VKHEPLFSSTARPQSTLAQWRDYWAEYPDRFSRALRPPQRQTAAREMYSYLPSSAPSPSVEGRARAVGPARSLHGELGTPIRTAPSSSGAGASPVRASPVLRTGDFFSAAEAQRAHVSPLGGKVW
jgi:hypothetical protein